MENDLGEQAAFQNVLTYEEAQDFLFQLPRFAEVGAAAYQPGLERITALLEFMGNPHIELSAIHIAGTNGKGSTASLVAAIGTASRKRIGLHTSPHLFDFAERMRIGGQPAPHGWIAEATGRFQEGIRSIGASFFEASTALSLLYFAEGNVDAAVVEVGMGGRLDATNILKPRVCAVTHIGFDHQEQLGATLATIAKEKGGIAKEGVPLLSAVKDELAVKALKAVAVKAGARFENIRETTLSATANGDSLSTVANIRTPLRTYDALRIGLPGHHQVVNASLAIRLAETMWPTISEESIRVGLEDVNALSGLRGRFEMISNNPRIFADVAHNIEGWQVAVELATRTSAGKLYVLLGVMADKEVKGLTGLLAAHEVIALPVGLATPRAMLQALLRETLDNGGVRIQNVSDAAEGVNWFCENATEGDVLLVTGSHLTVAEAFAGML